MANTENGKGSRLVYSSEGDGLCRQCQRPLRGCVCGEAKPAAEGDGIARLRRETKGRGGKAVTIIDGLPLSPDELKKVARQLKQRCGVGGSVKGSTIEIQGDQREACRTALEANGYPCKLAGG